MNDAPCSCRASTYRMEDREMASTSRMFSSPGMPNTCVTPSFSRHSTIRSGVPRAVSATTTRVTGYRTVGVRSPGSRSRPPEADDHLSGDAAGALGAERLRQGGQLEGVRDHRAQRLAVDAGRQLAELVTAGFNDEVDPGCVLRGARALAGFLGDRHQGPARAQHRPGSAHGVTAHRVNAHLHASPLAPD